MKPEARLTAEAAKRELRKLSSLARARSSQRFFKTGRGEYGEGDRFIGVTVPQVRSVAKRFKALSAPELSRLIRSPIHEDRLLALIIAGDQYRRGDEREKERLYRFYLNHLEWINNWDLVDASAHVIVGAHLEGRDKKPLLKLARSKRLWDRRVAVVASWHEIRAGRLGLIFELSELLLEDLEDLMHKACGWMLREAGKRDEAALEKFLSKHGPRMPRTMLRYAIERFPEKKRKGFLRVKGND